MKFISRILPLVLALGLGLPAQEQEPTWLQLRAKAMAAFDSMNFGDCIELMSRAIEKAPRTEETAAAGVEMHRIRGTAFEQTGKPKQAVADLVKAVKLGHGIFEGEARVAIVNDLRSVARISMRIKDTAEAGAALRRALEIVEPLQETQADLHMTVLFELARAERTQRDWKAAARTLEHYLAALEKARGKDSADLVAPLWDLALCHRALGQQKQAIPLIERWIGIYEKVRGEGSPTTARGLALLCDCHLAIENFDEAESACARWLKCLERVTRKHPEAVTLFERRARIARARGDLGKETAHLEEAIARARELPWPEPRQIAGLQRHLAGAQRRANKLEAATKTIEAAIATYEKYPKKDVTPLLEARMERGLIRQAGGKLKMAEVDFRAVLAGWEKLVGKEHPLLLDPLRALVKLCDATERAEEANALRARIVRIEKQAAVK